MKQAENRACRLILPALLTYSVHNAGVLRNSLAPGYAQGLPGAEGVRREAQAMRDTKASALRLAWTRAPTCSLAQALPESSLVQPPEQAVPELASVRSGLSPGPQRLEGLTVENLFADH